MQDGFQLELSAIELAVLAGLLRYDSVPGIGEAVDPAADLRTVVRQAVRRLERKRLVRYGLEGVLYVRPELRRMIVCLCDARTVGLFTSDLSSGKRDTVYVLERDADTVLLQAVGNKFRLRLTETVTPQELVPEAVLTAACDELCESMLLEEAQLIRRHTAAFDREAARRQALACVHQPETATRITDILSGSGGYLSVQIYARRGTLYETVFHTLVAVTDGRAVRVSVDEHDVVHFDGVPPTWLSEQLQAQLSEGGAG